MESRMHHLPLTIFQLLKNQRAHRFLILLLRLLVGFNLARSLINLKIDYMLLSEKECCLKMDICKEKRERFDYGYLRGYFKSL